ncbi:MAG: hypothetical protein AAGJ28_05475 [Pseudomonadota bacterium]
MGLFESLDGIIGFLSAIIAAVAAATSVLFARRSARRQSQLQEVELANWKNQYLAEIRHWADDCMHALSKGAHLCDLDPEKIQTPSLFERRHALMIDLSSLIDRGRWFFPNEHLSANRTERRIFFRGFRDPLLDPLVAAYDLTKRLNYLDQSDNLTLRDDFVGAKLDFGAKLQIILDPSSRNADFERFLTMKQELEDQQKKKEPKD